MRALINGNEIYCETAGQGPPVMVMHGAPGIGDHRAGKRVFAPLEDSFTMLYYDHRGAGQSEGKPPMSNEQWVEDADALRAYLGWESMALVGGSYGGMLAMLYALRHQDRLTHLVLRGTTPRGSNMEAARRKALERGLAVDREAVNRLFDAETPDNTELRQVWRAILPLYKVAPDPAQLDTEAAETIYRYDTHNRAVIEARTYDVAGQLSRIRVPTLVVVGRHDWICPVECSEEIAAAIPLSRLAVLEQSGHGPSLEEKDRFIEVVREFLTSPPG